ncbi:GTP-binding protein [Labrenzia sp. DG1229]|uniref:CobW family GTP-binding protein n=1 Tax=Labrenzia sp. DG1229 TaxID=681847 RepID=UPI0006917157|nr:GTP-binding protein [Labrenzia sp. DG1229]
MHEQSIDRVPVITVGGFLGAGKTTLINRLLRDADDERIVVFVNDFGAINVDYDLIEAVEERRISMKNGCVCCTLNEDLIESMQSFLEEDESPSAFIVEASGVSDPRALDSSILMLEQTGLVRLDNRVYVVDAAHFQSSDFEDTELVVDHAAAADCIIVNKTDLVETGALESVVSTLKTASPYATLIKSKFADCPSSMIINKVDRDFTDAPEKEQFHVSHHHGFASWSRQTNRLINRRRFEEFAKRLPDYCFRAKGQLFFEGELSGANIFHLVGRCASIEPKGFGDNQRNSRIVVIGKKSKLNQPDLDDWFDGMLS